MKNIYSLRLLLITISAIVITNSTAYSVESVPKSSKMYQGFGNYSRTITTESEEAQKWFDQGMQLLYGFNHDEAIRSFHAAATVDPTAAMPWWGIAYAHGININDPEMTEARSRAARKAADKAFALLDNASEAEVALIKSVSARYEYPAPEDRYPLDLAYADAMEEANAAHPNDPEIGTLFADSLMNLQPWNYWDNESKPIGRVMEILSTLETVLVNHPRHPGANHFYIHTVEASNNPDRAEAAADRLQTLVPGAGHLVHMPSHIYVRVGRYSDAVNSNTNAVAADRIYFETAPKPDMYALYYAHNLHFLAYAAMMSGRYEDAMKAARDLESEIPEDTLRAYASIMDGVMPTTFHVLIRFGKWEEILNEPEYPDYRFVSRAVRKYARSIALSALGRTREARQEIKAFEAITNNIPKDWYVFNNRVDAVLPIGRAMIKGELLFREGKYDEAFAILREGVEAEDNLVYDEPPGWMLPVRHALGALLMAHGKYAEAEQVYREDLQKNRNNGWGLLGLQKSLNAQKKNAAESIRLSGLIATALENADVMPTSSCFCEPGI